MTTAHEIAVAVPARAAALAWLNAFLAASKDESRPVVHQTLAIEIFPSGVQMVATSGHMLFRTWVPAKEEAKDAAAWPELEEAPEKTLVVMDLEGFAAGFMRVLLRLTSDEAHAFDLLNLSTSPHDEGATLLLGDEFMSERLSLRASGQRIDLKLFEGEYVNWRDLYRRGKGEDRTERIRLDADYLGAIGKLKEVEHVELMFGGEEKAVWIKATGEGVPKVLGILMPVRRGG